MYLREGWRRKKMKKEDEEEHDENCRRVGEKRRKSEKLTIDKVKR